MRIRLDNDEIAVCGLTDKELIQLLNDKYVKNGLQKKKKNKKRIQTKREKIKIR